MGVATKLSSALVAPSKVANLLDWRKAFGSVMALDITRNNVGMAVATHPDQHADVIALKPMSFLVHPHDDCDAPFSTSSSSWRPRKNQVPKEWITELEAAVRRHHVCAFVVNWPTHEGRVGEQCGKVLQVLDSVMDQSNSVVTRKRPFTLWRATTTLSGNSASSSLKNFCADHPLLVIDHEDSNSCSSSSLDEWGRSIDFSKAPAFYPDMYYSSKYPIWRQESLSSSSLSSSVTSSETAAHVLNEWIRNHWEMDANVGRVIPVTKNSVPHFCKHSVDEYNSEKACLQSALL